MTKVEIDGKTYCVETLIYERERLIKDVKASAENHRLVLDMIRAEIEQSRQFYEASMEYMDGAREQELSWVLKVIDKYIPKSEEGEGGNDIPNDCPLAEIVTCKDCDYCTDENYCIVNGLRVKDDFYCADAVRRA